MDSTNSTTKASFNSSFSDEGRPESYFSYTTALLQAAFSDDKKKLKQLIIDSRFKEILAEWLGFEAGNFYFFDSQLDSFEFFHKALSDDGIKIPWFIIEGTEPGSKRFIASERTEREKKNLRSKQQTHMNDPKEPTTASLCFKNLSDKKNKSRRSKIEIEEQWILIPRGERALFCFEWQVVKRLENMQCRSYKQAESMIVSSDFIEGCWDDIYDNPKYNQMLSEGKRDYKEAISWLREIFDHQNDYDYLWDNSYPLNWFVFHRTEVVAMLAQSSFDEGINFDLLRKFAALIVRPHPQSNTNATLESSNFYKRCRFSPPMELLFGSHNLIAFLLTVPVESSPIEAFPVESSLIEASGSPYAFLLGSFHESEVCRLHAPELKNIFYLLAIRDIILFSNYRGQYGKQKDQVKSLKRELDISVSLVSLSKLIVDQDVDTVEEFNASFLSFIVKKLGYRHGAIFIFEDKEGVFISSDDEQHNPKNRNDKLTYKPQVIQISDICPLKKIRTTAEKILHEGKPSKIISNFPNDTTFKDCRLVNLKDTKKVILIPIMQKSVDPVPASGKQNVPQSGVDTNHINESYKTDNLIGCLMLFDNRDKTSISESQLKELLRIPISSMCVSAYDMPFRLHGRPSFIRKMLGWKKLEAIIKNSMDFLKLGMLFIGILFFLWPFLIACFSIISWDQGYLLLAGEKFGTCPLPVVILKKVELLVMFFTIIIVSQGILVLFSPRYSQGLPQWMKEFAEVKTLEKTILSLVVILLSISFLTIALKKEFKYVGHLDLKSTAKASFAINENMSENKSKSKFTQKEKKLPEASVQKIKTTNSVIPDNQASEGQKVLEVRVLLETHPKQIVDEKSPQGNNDKGDEVNSIIELLSKNELIIYGLAFSFIILSISIFLRFTFHDKITQSRLRDK